MQPENYVYVLSDFDKSGELPQIRSTVGVFASPEAIVKYFHHTTITSEFSTITNLSDVLEYIAGSTNSVIKVQHQQAEGELFELIGLTKDETPKYYHIYRTILHK